MAVTDAVLIQSLTRQLDEAVPREGHFEVASDPNDLALTHVRANQLGYLRFGIELLKAAYASPESGGEDGALTLDLAYLQGFDHDSYSFERREDVWSPMWTSDASPGIIGQLMVGLIGLFFVASFLIGAYSIVRLLFNFVV